MAVMFIRIFVLSILLCFPGLVLGQISRFEPTKINDQKSLKIVTTRNNIYTVAATVAENENALGLAVGHRHGLDVCSGGLFVTKTRIMFKSLDRPDHNFAFSRSELKRFDVNDWKSFGKAVYRQITIKTEKRDYNFYPATDSGIYNLNTLDFPYVLEWFSLAITDFDQAWNRFEDLYENNVPLDVIIASDGQRYKIHERYDKFKDLTFYATSQMMVKTSRSALFLQAVFSSPGQSASQPKTVSLFIDANESTRKRFKFERSLIFLVDGERVNFGDMEWLDSTYIPGGRYTSGTVIDELGISIPWDVFIKISKAKTVEFQVGTVEATLDSTHLTLFKNLIEKVGR